MNIISIVLIFFPVLITTTECQALQFRRTTIGEVTNDSILLHTEDFTHPGDVTTRISLDKTITVGRNIDGMVLTSMLNGGVITVTDGGVGHNFVRVASWPHSAGAPINTRIEIYSNGALANCLSVVLVMGLFLIYYVL